MTSYKIKIKCFAIFEIFKLYFLCLSICILKWTTYFVFICSSHWHSAFDDLCLIHNRQCKIHNLFKIIFTEMAPLGRFSHRVAMSVCLSGCLFAPSDAVFLEASHWPWDHMIISRPLMGPPSLPPPPSPPAPCPHYLFFWPPPKKN